MCNNGICTNMDGSFKCVCNPGYVLSSSGFSCIGKGLGESRIFHLNFFSCLDIDECAENVRICLAGRCENLDGSYRCICDNGYTHIADGSFCTDKDECAETGMCDNGQCVNMDGSFKCVCQPGYTLSPSGKTCIGIRD